MATAKVKVTTKNTNKSKGKAPGSATLHGLSPYVEKKNEEFMNQRSARALQAYFEGMAS